MAILQRVVLRETASVVHTVGTVLGGAIPLPAEVSYVTLHLNYTKGDETNVLVWPTFLDVLGGIESGWMDWTTAAGVKTLTANTLSLAASGAANFTFDVTGMPLVLFHEQAIGGTPTGLLAATLTLKGA